jgi:orotidine-5'-phosphate decarboxylase
MNIIAESQHPGPRLILALDVDSAKIAHNFIDLLFPQIKIFKVGLQLFTLAGPAIIKYIEEKGAEVFLDLKFFDIPHTVALAVREAVRLKTKMLTIHISGGDAMLQTSVQAAQEEAHSSAIKRPLLIGVTVLTSQEADAEEVLKLAKKGLWCGLDGVACSAKEAALLRKEIKKPFIIVTPGIRPHKEASDDQKRTATVREAIEAGSDFLVIGRPILQADDPLLAAQEIMSECQ